MCDHSLVILVHGSQRAIRDHFQPNSVTHVHSSKRPMCDQFLVILVDDFQRAMCDHFQPNLVMLVHDAERGMCDRLPPSTVMFLNGQSECQQLHQVWWKPVARMLIFTETIGRTFPTFTFSKCTSLENSSTAGTTFNEIRSFASRVRSGKCVTTFSQTCSPKFVHAHPTSPNFHR